MISHNCVKFLFNFQLSQHIQRLFKKIKILDYKLFLGQMAQGNSRAAQIITGS